MIIKLTDNTLISSDKYTQDFCDLFNESFKSRFVWWLRCKYIILLEDLPELQFIEYSQNSQKSDADIETDLNNGGVKFIKTSDISDELVDYSTSIKLIDTEKYKKSNLLVPSADININDLKNFRTWLADSLLTGVVYDFSESQKTMLQYYKNNMYNDILGAIKNLGVYNSNSTKPKKSCCCSTNSANSSNVAIETDQFKNCADLYILKLHNDMVNLFTDIDFWSSNLIENTTFLKQFKTMIDNIIDYEFEIYSTIKEQNKTILKNLSTTIQYILNSETDANYNFISESLYNWAEYMYDYMIFE